MIEELGGGLLDIHAFDVAQDEDEAERIGQRIHGILEHVPDMAARRLALGARRRGRRKRQHPSFLQFRVGQLDGRATTSRAAQRLVQRDPGQPGRKARLAAEGGEIGEGAHIGLLDDILGLGIVAQHGAGHAEQPPVVTPDEDADRTLVALRGKPHERLVGECLQISLSQCGCEDIACGDAWYTDDKGYPLFEEAEGRSLIVSRTQIGEELVRRAIEAGYIVAQSLDPAEIVKMQPAQARRKQMVLSRLAAMALFAPVVPRFAGLQLWNAARTASLRQNLRSFLGMAWRLFRGAGRARDRGAQSEGTQQSIPNNS